MFDDADDDTAADDVGYDNAGVRNDVLKLPCHR
jgi:hypothetical protein